MKVCSSQQMRLSDEISIKDYLIPGIVLMENAALGIIKEIRKEINNGKLPKEGHALIICGTGNNGGDGFAVARHLVCMGWKTRIIICGGYNKITGDALINLKIIEKMGLSIIHEDEGEASLISNVKSDLIIDAMLGTGFKGELKPEIQSIVESINSNNTHVISADIPTGLNSDTGFIDSVCVKADKTVTFGLPKIGLVINEGPFYCGELITESLTIPDEVYDKAGVNKYLTDDKFLRKCLLPRNVDSHKGTYGKVLTIACSKGMTGAGLLASEAALRSGAGIVELAVPESLLNTVSGKIPEIITRGLSESKGGYISSADSDKLIREYGGTSSMLIGPGLGTSDEVFNLIYRIIKECNNPIIIDADGLNSLAEQPSICLEKIGEIILTPHPGEMARLAGISIGDVQKDRIGVAEKFAKKYQVVVVLKGYRTIIATPWGETWINPTGNPGMATAGSGDVLAGIITAFTAQGLKNYVAAICGTYIHGLAGDNAAKYCGEWGITATDIIGFIANSIKNIS